MSNKIVFSNSEIKTLEKIKTPLGIYHYKNKKLESLILTDGLCTFFNKDRESLIPFLKDEIKNYIYKTDYLNLLRKLNDVSKNPEKPFNIEYRLKFDWDAQYLWILNEITCEKIENNSYVFYVYFKNNTECHEYKKEYKSLAENIIEEYDTITPLDVKSNIVALNRSMAYANFYYWIYDVTKDTLFNGNIFYKIMGENKYIKNYPQSFFDSHLIHNDDIPLFNIMFEKSLSGEKIVEDNIRVLRPEKNDYVLAHIRFISVKDKNDKVLYIISSAENFSTYAQVFDMINNLLSKNELITWSYIIKEKTITYKDLDFSSKELKKISSLIYDAIDDDRIKIPTALLENKLNKSYELMNFEDDKGKEYTFEITHTVYKKNNMPYAIIGMARDVTKFYENEKIYIKELEKANTNKSSFLSRLSHDMRTPLGAISSLSTFGIEESEETLAVNYFSKIRDNSEYLLSFISDVLDSRKINDGTLVFQPVVFKPYLVVDQILSIIKLRANDKDIDLIVDTIGDTANLYYYTDVAKIKQVAINLLTNAIKYTPRCGEVKFLLECYKKGDKINVKCIISDNGVGMSKEFQERMFDEFSQEHNKLSFEEEGTGLGLSIVKQIVDLFNAKLTCESELNKGTTFTIEFQSDIANEEQIKEYTNKLNNKRLDKLNGKKVLICEDKQINVMIITKLLKDKNMIYDVANDGEMGVEKVRNNKYDVILMDIRMPKVDGLKATRIIREFNKSIPIIALSANVSPEDIQKSIETGMNDHLSKPIDKIELYNSIYTQIFKK